jgi:hypothetical protein
MTAIGPANWEEYEPLKRRFRELLRQTVIRVLKTSMDPIDEYWSSLSDSSPGEQLLALHDDPLDLAAVLTGVTLTPEMTERYDRMLSETFSDLVLGNPPYSVGVVVDAVRSPGEDVVDEVPPDLYRDARPVRPEISGFVPRRAVTLLLERLGYSRLGREGQLAVWQLSDDGFQELPEVVLVPRPTISATGERGYDKRSVLNLYDWIIWLAQRRGASSETLRMLQDQRDQFAGGVGVVRVKSSRGRRHSILMRDATTPIRAHATIHCLVRTGVGSMEPPARKGWSGI